MTKPLKLQKEICRRCYCTSMSSGITSNLNKRFELLWTGKVWGYWKNDTEPMVYSEGWIYIDGNNIDSNVGSTTYPDWGCIKGFTSKRLSQSCPYYLEQIVSQ